MGFEHRKSVRIKADFHLFFWLGEDAQGPSLGGQAENLSETGVAFRCERPFEREQPLMLELSLPDKGGPLRVLGSVLRCEEHQGSVLVRVRFTQMDGDSQLRLEQHVLLVSDPKLAAATGWGKAYFEEQRRFRVRYRELPAGLREKWLDDRSYLDVKGLIYLRAFRAFLESALGEALPKPFKVLGSRAVQERSIAWLELRLPEGALHLLAEALWCQAEPGESAIVGLLPVAFHKEEALRIEKGA